MSLLCRFYPLDPAFCVVVVVVVVVVVIVPSAHSFTSHVFALEGTQIFFSTNGAFRDHDKVQGLIPEYFHPPFCFSNYVLHLTAWPMVAGCII